MGATATNMILGNDRRMLLIEFLKEKNGSADLRDLVEYIAEKEGNTNRKHRKSVYVSLIQTHLPRLEREGVIAFEHGTVTLLRIPNDVTVYMEVVKKNDISWSTFYIGTSMIFLVLGAYLRSFPLLLTAFVYLVISTVHHQKVRRVL